MQILLIVLAIAAVCIFEFINGFHDTANAVATVIYTNTLKPMVAVTWSGFWNFLGVWSGGIAVAMSIVGLLPLMELMDMPLNENMALIFAILLAAIIWNFTTWYFGIPASSSHTLIGSILGAGLGFYYVHGGDGINWSKASDIGLSLLLSPAFGFSLCVGLLFLFRQLIKNKEIFQEPDKDKTPPMWIRAILITTCTLVSFFHGSNDGQKGVGIMMVILLTLMPAKYALDANFNAGKIDGTLTKIENILDKESKQHVLGKELQQQKNGITELRTDLKQMGTATGVQKIAIRKRIQNLVKQLEVYKKDPSVFSNSRDGVAITAALKELKSTYQFAPTWVILAIALSLSIGTMIGWKRIVVTIGEKIGKTHLTYAQGAAAEIVAASTIGLSTGLGLPVSTTHVLSSAIAGSMVAGNGLKNLQKNTVITIAMAWILTLPVTIVLAMLLYWLFRVF